jgi:hypothetical protein
MRFYLYRQGAGTYHWGEAIVPCCQTVSAQVSTDNAEDLSEQLAVFS